MTQENYLCKYGPTSSLDTNRYQGLMVLTMMTQVHMFSVLILRAYELSLCNLYLQLRKLRKRIKLPSQGTYDNKCLNLKLRLCVPLSNHLVSYTLSPIV